MSAQTIEVTAVKLLEKQKKKNIMSIINTSQFRNIMVAETCMFNASSISIAPRIARGHVTSSLPVKKMRLQAIKEENTTSISDSKLRLRNKT